MLIGPAIGDTDPIRHRSPSHGGHFSGNILSKAMRAPVIFRRRLAFAIDAGSQSVEFHTKALAPLGITERYDSAGKGGPPGHPDLKGFAGANNHFFFWLREGTPAPGAVHVGIIADSEKDMQDAYASALAAGATQIHPPGPQVHYDPRYHAAQVRDLDGCSLEFVYKSWQH